MLTELLGDLLVWVFSILFAALIAFVGVVARVMFVWKKEIDENLDEFKEEVHDSLSDLQIETATGKKTMECHEDVSVRNQRDFGLLSTRVDQLEHDGKSQKLREEMIDRVNLLSLSFDKRDKQVSTWITGVEEKVDDHAKNHG